MRAIGRLPPLDGWRQCGALFASKFARRYVTQKLREKKRLVRRVRVRARVKASAESANCSGAARCCENANAGCEPRARSFGCNQREREDSCVIGALDV